MPLECSNYKKCPFGRECKTDCILYSPFHCKRRDRSPGACNGCTNWRHCRFNKYKYSPEDAWNDYRYTLVDSRQGVNLTVKQAKDIADVMHHSLNKVYLHIKYLLLTLNLVFLKRLYTTT